MPTTLKIEAQLSKEELLKAVGQLNLSELEQFVYQVIALQAQRKAPSLSKEEAELLLKINQGIPPDLQERYNALITKRRNLTLTPDEHAELLRLSDQVEALTAQRVEYMAQLAILRKTSLTALMAELEIKPPVADV